MAMTEQEFVFGVAFRMDGKDVVYQVAGRPSLRRTPLPRLLSVIWHESDGMRWGHLDFTQALFDGCTKLDSGSST